MSEARAAAPPPLANAASALLSPELTWVANDGYKGWQVKLGEALALRSDIQARVHQLKGRLATSAQVQEGETAPEDPDALLREFDALVDQWVDLVRRINRTNLATQLSDGMTVTDALALRDALTEKYKTLRSVADSASEQTHRYSRAEIRILPAVDVGALRVRVGEIAQQRRELDVLIQETNWRTDLLD
jgi:hypothetical protein